MASAMPCATLETEEALKTHLLFWKRAAALSMFCLMPLGCGPAAVDDTATDHVAEQALLSQGYVQTPSGYVHGGCIHELAEGDTLDGEGNIVRAGGRVDAVQACGKKEYAHISDSETVAAEQSSDFPSTNGYVEYATMN